MKKNTITALYNYFVNSDDTVDLSTVVEDVRAEYERFADKASEKTALYDAAEKVLLGALTDTPQTSRAIFDANVWPDGFTVGKLNYALRAMWADEIVKHDNGKSAFTYTAKP